MTKTVIPGDEFGDHLRRLLAKVMHDVGAKTLNEKWGVAGSIELETVTLELRGTTHSGLSITGDEHDVDDIAEQSQTKEQSAERYRMPYCRC